MVGWEGGRSEVAEKLGVVGVRRRRGRRGGGGGWARKLSLYAVRWRGG